MVDPKIKLSVALATYNEAENIRRALLSVRSIAAEIIIVDGGSTDGTIGIAESLGAKVINTDNPKIFHINKQKALDECRGEWILQLDADEEVSCDLAGEIKEVIGMSGDELSKRKINPQKLKLFMRHQQLVEKLDQPESKSGKTITAFFIPRLNFFLGKPIRHAGTYPDGVIRLVRNGYACFPAKSVHEQIKIEGQTGWLNSDLFHYTSPTLKKYFSGLNKYTDLQADGLRVKRLPVNAVSVFNYNFNLPLKIFLGLYIRHKGFLDGWRGFLFSVFSALHYPVAFWKYIRVSRYR